MKATEQKKQWVKNRIIKYCQEAEKEVPSLLLLTKKEWQEWAEFKKQQIGVDRYRNAGNYLGICNHKSKVIAIFIKNHCSCNHLDQTIRHELAHYFRRYNHRSEAFARTMMAIRLGKFKANERNRING